MVDAHLNSVHLPAARRDDFRHARDILFQARGTATQCLDAGQMPVVRSSSHAGDRTFQSDKQADASHYVLVDRDRTYSLKPGTNTVGRLPDNDVVVASPQVSRRHCAVLIHANDACELHDIASKNGTFVNGQKISSPTRLKPGDEIVMCDYRLILKCLTSSKDSKTQCE